MASDDGHTRQAGCSFMQASPSCNGAHAMLPYMCQGAALAAEDAVVLAEALSHAHHPSSLLFLLHRWEGVRVNRATQMRQASLVNGKILHFREGTEQQAKDAEMQNEVLGMPISDSQNQWSDPVTQKWAYRHNAIGEMRRAIKSDSTFEKWLEEDV